MDVGHMKMIRKALDLAPDRTTGVTPELPEGVVAMMDRAERLMKTCSARSGFSREAIIVMLAMHEEIEALKAKQSTKDCKPSEPAKSASR